MNPLGPGTVPPAGRVPAPDYPAYSQHPPPAYPAYPPAGPGFVPPPPTGQMGPGFVSPPPPGQMGPGTLPPPPTGPVRPAPTLPPPPSPVLSPSTSPEQRGVIPLRPLTLTDIYNGAVDYIRANPRVALGLTAIIVVITQVIVVGVQISPLSGMNVTHGFDPYDNVQKSAVTGWDVATILVTWPADFILGGMLTVVIGRAVFGAPITIGETWRLTRSRIWPLLGLAGIGGLVGIALLAVVVLTLIGGIVVGLIIGLPLLMTTGLLLLPALYAITGFAAGAIMLERLPLFAAIRRALQLIRGGFWRVVGIVVLTYFVMFLIGLTMTTPFTIIGMILGSGLVGDLAVQAGATMVMIVVMPFVIAVVVLLYTDRRIRSEAFDLAVQSALAAPGGVPVDHLWLTRAWV